MTIAKTCGSTFRSYYPCPHCPPLWYHFVFGPGQMGVLWANRCPSVSLPEERVECSSFYKPESQTDWRWPKNDQMLFDVRSMWNMCLQCWADSMVWTCSHTAQLHRRQSCSGFCLFACNCVMKISSVWGFFSFFFFVPWHMWECFENFESLLGQIKAVFLCCCFAGHFMECCWAGQWPEPAWMALVLLVLS